MAATSVENVKVYIRVRPIKIKEETQKLKEATLIQPDRTKITLLKPNVEKTFKFNEIFDKSSTQQEIYNKVAQPIVEKMLKGYNGTIFAYGQSGTGKTYTMLGNPLKEGLKGIVPQIFSHIFHQISQASKEVSYVVTATYLEIYNEEIHDLLSNHQNLKMRERNDIGVFVKDLLGFTVSSIEEATELLLRGSKHRSTGTTQLNRHSSRSHAIFTVMLESKNHQTNTTHFGKLNLVDLAGSERVKKTLATGKRLKEAGKINLSLSVLGNVISALVDGKTNFIPYRNSKLTRLLQDSLGGNCMTAMIALVSPLELDYDESNYTLMYADRVQHIQNIVSVNRCDKQSVIEKFECKIKQLAKELQDLSKIGATHAKFLVSSKDADELQQIEDDKRKLQEKIQLIQDKILIGGESFSKLQQQESLLECTEKQLEFLDMSSQKLQETLRDKNKEIEDVNKKYLSLQEENGFLEGEIGRVEGLVAKYERILFKKEAGYQKTIKAKLFENKCLSKKMSLVNLLNKELIPNEFLQVIQANMGINEESGEYEIKGLAYAGNNVKQTRKSKKVSQTKLKTSNSNVYQHYQ